MAGKHVVTVRRDRDTKPWVKNHAEGEEGGFQI
jgi:hypothetical protein